MIKSLAFSAGHTGIAGGQELDLKFENKRKEIGGIKRYTCELTLSRHGIPLILWSFFLKDQISILEKRIEIMPTAIKQSH